MNLHDIAIITEKDIVFKECSSIQKDDVRVTCHITGVEIIESGCLVSTFGIGVTKKAAAKDYANALAGQRIAIDTYTDIRKELPLPNKINWKWTE